MRFFGGAEAPPFRSEGAHFRGGTAARKLKRMDVDGLDPHPLLIRKERIATRKGDGEPALVGELDSAAQEEYVAGPQ